MSQQHPRLTLSGFLFLLAGIALCTGAQAFFLIPNKILPSGLTGIGTIFYHAMGMPIGLFVILGNIFLIAIQARLLGPGMSGISLAAIVSQGLLLDLSMTVFHVKPLATDPMLASIYGGLLTGVGVSFIYRGHGTLGGSDIVAQLLLKFKHIPAGTTLLWVDLIILSCAALIYGPDLALFAVIKSFIVTRTVDSFMEGFAVNRQVMIISEQAQTIAWGIMEELRRGATLLQARGGYTNNPMEVVMTAIRRREIIRLEEIVYQIDPHAFLIINDARRVVGRGFANLETLVEIDESTDLNLPETELPSGNGPTSPPPAADQPAKPV